MALRPRRRAPRAWTTTSLIAICLQCNMLLDIFKLKRYANSSMLRKICQCSSSAVPTLFTRVKFRVGIRAYLRIVIFENQCWEHNAFSSLCLVSDTTLGSNFLCMFLVGIFCFVFIATWLVVIIIAHGHQLPQTSGQCVVSLRGSWLLVFFLKNVIVQSKHFRRVPIPHHPGSRDRMKK